MRLFILGLPGSGKGTISALLARDTIPYYNVGERLRQQSDKDRHIKEIHAAGGLVDSDRVLGIFEEALQQEHFICDGSPRKSQEADFILNHPKWLEKPGILVYLKLPEEIAKIRLEARKRYDDKPDIVEKRIAGFHSETIHSIEKFKQAGRLCEVDATKSSQEIVEYILGWLGHFD